MSICFVMFSNVSRSYEEFSLFSVSDVRGIHTYIHAYIHCHNEDGRIQLRKREFITRSNTQRELKVELFVDRGGAFRRQKRSFP